MTGCLSVISLTGSSLHGWGSSAPTGARMLICRITCRIQRMAIVSLQPGPDEITTADLIA